MAGPKSGEYSQIKIGSSNVVECMAWTFNRTVNTHPYRTCSTTGTDGKTYTKRVSGGHDATGNIKGLQTDDDPIENYFVEGSEVTLKLYWYTNKYYQVPATIAKLNVEADRDSGAPVPWDADYEANGQWTVV